MPSIKSSLGKESGFLNVAESKTQEDQGDHFVLGGCWEKQTLERGKGGVFPTKWFTHIVYQKRRRTLYRAFLKMRRSGGKNDSSPTPVSDAHNPLQSTEQPVEGMDLWVGLEQKTAKVEKKSSKKEPEGSHKV